MDIQNIRAFLMVAETQSFSRAAEKLFLTQPAISKRIATLEDSLDCQLFDRLGKNIQLTQAGQALIPSYQRILSEINETRRIISTLRSEVSGHLKFGTSHHIGLHRLPPVLQAYTKQYAEVELDLNFMDSEQACKLVLNGDVELAIVTLPITRDERLSRVPVWKDQMHCVAAKNHALAKTQKVMPEDLWDAPAILPPSGSYTRTLIDRALGLGDASTDEPPQSKSSVTLLETHYLETIKAMVEIGLGWSVLPESMLDKKLKALTVAKVRITRDLGVIFHNKRTLSNAANAMLNLLKQHKT